MSGSHYWAIPKCWSDPLKCIPGTAFSRLLFLWQVRLDEIALANYDKFRVNEIQVYLKGAQATNKKVPILVVISSAGEFKDRRKSQNMTYTFFTNSIRKGLEYENRKNQTPPCEYMSVCLLVCWSVGLLVCRKCDEILVWEITSHSIPSFLVYFCLSICLSVCWECDEILFGFDLCL